MSSIQYIPTITQEDKIGTIGTASFILLSVYTKCDSENVGVSVNCQGVVEAQNIESAGKTFSKAEIT